MTAFRGILLLVGGFAIGWFVRDWTDEDTSARTDRRPTPTATQPRGGMDPIDDERDGRPETERVQRAAAERARTASDQGGEVAQPAGDEAGEPAEGDGEAGKAEGDEEDPVAEMTKAMTAQWKGWATMQARQKVQALLAELGFDAQTNKLIEDAVVKEAERQTERAVAMMLGEAEMDQDAFAYFMGLPPDLTPDLERELGTFLNDNEIHTVRQEVKKAYDKQLDDMADMQVNMMGISDMTDDQKRQVKEVFAGKDYMQEQFSQFAEVTRDRGVLKKLISGEIDLAKEMEKSFESRRRRMRDILTDTQFEKYKQFEQSQIKQAEMGIKMFAGMLKQDDNKKK